jgi:excisionase family DNA binding protein
MNSNLDKVRARARLLLAADKWRELIQFLERDVPTLVAEVEQLQRELAEARSYEGRLRLPPPEVPQPAARGQIESQLLTSKQFAHAIGVSEACVRRWTMERKIKVVRLGRLVRIPRSEIQRLSDEGAIPARPSRSQPQ